MARTGRPVADWLNQVERWFGLLTDQKLRRGVHKSLRAGKRHPRLDQGLERRPSALHLDQDR
jgi:hypothetical protein